MNKATVVAALAAAVVLLASGCSAAGGGGATPSLIPSTDTVDLKACLNDAAGTVDASTSGNTSATIKPSGGFAADAKIGISMPQKTSQSVVEAEAMFTTALKAAGFAPTVVFATNGVADQQSQIADLVKQGVSVLVVSAVDGAQLATQLDAAKAAGAVVIADDTLVTGTKSVDMYVAYDAFQAGQLQGQALIQGMLASQGDPPYNVELIAGAPTDAAATSYFTGAMSVLQPAIDCGAIAVPSGQTTQAKAATVGGMAVNAQSRLDGIITSFYGSAKLNGVLSPNDTLARAALTSLGNAGLGESHIVVTGNGSDTASIPLVMKGTQYMTIYESTQGMVDEVVKAITLMQQGKPVPVNDTTGFDNGATKVPADLLTPLVVTASNAVQAYAKDPTRIGCTRNPVVNCQ